MLHIRFGGANSGRNSGLCARTRQVLVVVGAALVASSGSAIAPRAAAGADLSASLFASVDQQKLGDGYAKHDEIQKELQQIAAAYTQRLKLQAGYDMLSEDQQSQLGVLLAKPAPSDAEKATITQLEDGSAHDAQELTALQQKQNLTDAEKARLTQLTTKRQAGQQAIQQAADAYKDQLDAQQAKILGALSDKVKAAIAAIAKERGIAVVFDSTYTVYCANDITDEVLKRINKP